VDAEVVVMARRVPERSRGVTLLYLEPHRLRLQYSRFCGEKCARLGVAQGSSHSPSNLEIVKVSVINSVEDERHLVSLEERLGGKAMKLVDLTNFEDDIQGYESDHSELSRIG
ncbi:hypothetical protein HAX54_036166, partial [Datura stramonium]|nr:hypothetical protein [Datura stramonium]